MKTLYLGIDVGSRYCKAAVLNDKKELKGYHISFSGTSFEIASENSARKCLQMNGYDLNDIKCCVSTGYGRENVPFRFKTVSEISCHSKAAFEKYKSKLTLIDIGGQDNKVIQMDESGKMMDFTMNRKCAAGTGSFIEEMALRLNVKLEDMDALARKADKLVQLGSFCTVFASTEVLEKIRAGENVNNIVKGVFYSILKRVLSMGTLKDRIAMTGGVVAHNPYLVEMMRDFTKCEVFLPTYPQLFGAIGAALYAMEVK